MSAVQPKIYGNIWALCFGDFHQDFQLIWCSVSRFLGEEQLFLGRVVPENVAKDRHVLGYQVEI